MGKISEAHAKRLTERGLDIDLCEALGFRSSGSALGHDYVVDGRVLNTKMRRGKGNMPWERPWDGVKAPLWNIDCLKAPIEPGEVLVIAEGELDGASLIQAEFARTVSVPTGAPAKPEGAKSDRYDCFRKGDSLLPDIDKFEKIIIATDNDGPGEALRDDLSELLGDHRCWWVKFPDGCKDANDVLQSAHGEKGLIKVVESAKPMWSDEVGRPEDFEDREAKTYRVWSTADESDNAKLDLRIELPSFVVILGPYSSGKSTFLRQLLWSMYELNGWKFLLTCLEEPVRPRVYNKFLTLALGQTPGSLSVTNVEHGEDHRNRLILAKKRVNDAARFLVRPKGKLLTPEHFFDRVKMAVRRDGVKVIALDPVNELDHHVGVGNETHYWGNFILDCKAIADEFALSFIVSGHPGKDGYNRLGFKKLLRALDMSGSANWGNKADVAMNLWRLGKGDNSTLLHMEKIKDHETMGEPALYRLEHSKSKQRFKVADVGWDLWKDEGKQK